ncbi:MAG: hypothetical protein MR669_08390 [Selenomonadaceae bacterium]|nr:hypothetical protein [Selenomonadaceae bacterium]
MILFLCRFFFGSFAVCILTTFIFMYTGDKFNRRKVFGIFSGLGVVSWFVWALPANMLQMWMLFFFTIVWGCPVVETKWLSAFQPCRFFCRAFVVHLERTDAGCRWRLA